jgi:hypothetical protein
MVNCPGYVVGLPKNSYKPFTNTACVRAQLDKLQKVCTRLAATSEKAYQLLAHCRWFSPGTPASSTTKTKQLVSLFTCGCESSAHFL